MGKKAKPGYKLVQNFFKQKFEIPTEWDYPKFSKVVKVNPPTRLTAKIAKYIPMDAVDTEKPHVNYFEDRESASFIRPFKAFEKEKDADAYAKALGHLNVSITEIELESKLQTKTVVDVKK